MFTIRLKGFDNIVFGFFLFFIGGVLVGRFSNDIIQAVVKAIGWIFIIKGFIVTKKGFHTNHFGRIYSFLLKLFLLQGLIIIARGYLIDYKFQWLSTAGMVNYHLFSDSYILPFLMPLVLLIPYKYYNFSKMAAYGQLVALLGVVFFIVNLQDIMYISFMRANGYEVEGSGMEFAIYTSFAFIPFCVCYLPRRKWLLNLLGLISTIIIYMITGRRGQSLVNAVILVSCLYFFYQQAKSKSRFLQGIGIIIILAIASYYVLHSNAFIYLFERGLEDTRSAVDEALMSQMSTWEKVFGKGLNGRYYLPMDYNWKWDGYRYLSETGFYNLVLKGGYMYAINYILLLAIPAYLGIRKSKNFLCRCGGLFLLINILQLYPGGYPTFNVRFLCIWMIVAICMSKSARNMNDNQIKGIFFK